MRREDGRDGRPSFRRCPRLTVRRDDPSPPLGESTSAEAWSAIVHENEVKRIAAAMSNEELVAFAAGEGPWTTAAIPRLGIPALKVSDGPNGARGGGALIGGTKAAAFPVAIALSASWDTELVWQVGRALAGEAKTKGVRIVLAPTINMHRSTLNGRNFECYSEDPFLAGTIAAAYIEGLQSEGVAATVKHFIGNESEYQRTEISSDIDERTLREIYLLPFEMAVKQAHPWAVMTSYNRLNGVFTSENTALVTNVLKGEWGYDGVVMSDWFGTRSTVAAVKAGLDLEMPGPSRQRGSKLSEALRSGLVTRASLEESARRLIRLIDRVKAHVEPPTLTELAIDRPEDRALIRRAGADGAVLLKNAGLLPLAPDALKRIAVIGPNARNARIMGGGSAQLNPHYQISPFDGLRSALPDTVEIVFELGASNNRLVPLYAGDVDTEFYANRALSGPPVHRTTSQVGEFMFNGDAGPGFDTKQFSARMRSTFVPDESDDYQFGVVASGPVQVFVDGQLLIDGSNWEIGDEFLGSSCTELRAVCGLEGGQPYNLEITYRAVDAPRDVGISVLRFGVGQMIGKAQIDRAVAAARGADAVVLCVGLNGEWDSEGIDRPSLSLPGQQDELIGRIAAVNGNTIVVLQSGCPVLMPWLGQVSAVLQAWYPGQEAGNAIADVLLGHADPAGRLPQTFPVRIEDDPAYANYPGTDGTVRYEEGVFIGHRHYEKSGIAPAFPFGHGLSYADFSISNITLSARELRAGETLRVGLDVRNTSKRIGSTIVQFYLHDQSSSVERPDKELKAFMKVLLAPGETTRVECAIAPRSLAFFDVGRKAWVAEPGLFEIRVGFSSADIVGTAEFCLTEEWTEHMSASTG
ncbi:glycoside hydrolase family 3 C-terminal domain-containing protein (plasmid) [Rhizobium sp. CB3060]|uniref:beta-glucosidase n=1 Tax=Rhizobium sp. CB3060 TaxID=3138255 RepID=UPI0021A27845|nr:glycoside hydrolase family 3 C-terminal domain-containing protein [Rhizobium tropici]UWU26114.1 glycoside hydrolase family 3 C-terminal domain-containing protein [Rhizobium tropici]